MSQTAETLIDKLEKSVEKDNIYNVKLLELKKIQIKINFLKTIYIKRVKPNRMNSGLFDMFKKEIARLNEHIEKSVID